MQKTLVKSHTMRLRVWGQNACFTRPEMKVERVSYDVMTPSAARGILEAIHWKPAIRWQVEQIDVLNPIKWESVRRNEVGSTMSPKAGSLFIEDQRQQRAGLLLRDVDYVVHAYFEMTDKAGPEDTLVKHEQMFWRRAEKGQCFHRVYLGCREFAAYFSLVLDDEQLPETINESRDLGYMLHDIYHDNTNDIEKGAHFCSEKCQPLFFKAKLENGRMKVPSLDYGEVCK